MLRRMIVVASFSCLPATVSGFTALNGAEVVPLSNGVFEVVGEVSSGAGDYWCGAGDYAIGVLGTRATQRLYMWSKVGPSQTRPGRRAIQFSTSEPPSGPAPQSYSLSMKRIGDNMSASQAQGYCIKRKI